MKAISKVVAVLAVSALAFGMFGCSNDSSSSTTNPDEAQTYTSEDIKATDISVEKSGFSIVEDTSVDADGNEITVPAADYAFVVQNNNAGYVAQNVPFNVNGYNANGEVVFSGGASCMFIYPGIQTAVSGNTAITAEEGVDTNVVELTVEPLMSTVEWLKTGLTDSEIANMFTVENATAERTESGLQITASITGNMSDVDKVYKIANLETPTLEGHWIAIFTDANGNILFGSDSSPVMIDQAMMDSAQGEDGVELNNASATITNAPDYAEFEIYVMPSL